MGFSSFVGAIALIIAAYIMWQIRFVLLLAFAAIAIATSINCLVNFLMRRGIKQRSRAIFASLLLLTLVFVGFVVLIVPPFINQVQQSLYLFPKIVDKVEIWLTWMEAKVPVPLIGEIQKLENVTRNLPNVASQLIGNFYSIFSGSLEVLINIVLVLVVTVMLLANPRPYIRLFIALFPSFYRRRAAKTLKKCEKSLVGWTQGVIFNMLVITALSWLGLVILGIPLPLANALLAGLCTFIPNLGPLLSCIPPLILAIIDAPWKVAAVLILYLIVQQAESHIMTPLIMKKQTSLLPAITLLAQATFAIFFGLFGLFLALPLTVVAQVWIEELLIKDILSNWDPKKRNSGYKAKPKITEYNPKYDPNSTASEIITTEIKFSPEH